MFPCAGPILQCFAILQTSPDSPELWNILRSMGVPPVYGNLRIRPNNWGEFWLCHTYEIEHFLFFWILSLFTRDSTVFNWILENNFLPHSSLKYLYICHLYNIKKNKHLLTSTRCFYSIDIVRHISPWIFAQAQNEINQKPQLFFRKHKVKRDSYSSQLRSPLQV